MNKEGIAQIIIILIVGGIIGGTWFLAENGLIPSISTSAVKESCKKNCEDANKLCEKDCKAQNKADEQADKACHEACESDLKICKKNCKDKNETKSSDKDETENPESADCQTLGQSCTLINGYSGVCLKCKTETGCKLECFGKGTECFEPCGG